MFGEDLIEINWEEDKKWIFKQWWNKLKNYNRIC
jgi:hypothetical protein